MEAITNMSVLGMSEQTFATIVLAFIGLLGTVATVGYKYRQQKSQPEDNQKVLFDQVNAFIKQQKEDRDELRVELQELKEKLEEVEEDNRQKERKINELIRQLAAERRDKTFMADQIEELTKNAKIVAATKVIEDKERKDNA